MRISMSKISLYTTPHNDENPFQLSGSPRKGARTLEANDGSKGGRASEESGLETVGKKIIRK
jgi:hypothetical protein